MIDKYPNSKIMLVKNNSYRDNYGLIDRSSAGEFDIDSVVINWINEDRIISQSQVIGVPSHHNMLGEVLFHDLFPHLYCFMLHLFDVGVEKFDRISNYKMQKWNLDNISGSAYGVFQRKRRI